MAYFPPSQYKFEQLICSWLLRTPKFNRMWQIVKGIYYDRGVLQAELSLFAESHISGSLVAGNWETQPVNPSPQRLAFHSRGLTKFQIQTAEKHKQFASRKVFLVGGGEFSTTTAPGVCFPSVYFISWPCVCLVWFWVSVRCV